MDEGTTQMKSLRKEGLIWKLREDTGHITDGIWNPLKIRIFYALSWSIWPTNLLLKNNLMDRFRP